MSVLSLQAVGLIFCILGATILLRAFAFATFAELGETANSKNAAHSVLETLCAQRVDALFGAPLLVLGFGLQLLSSIGVSEKPLVMFLALAGIAVAVLYYSLMRDMIATRSTDSILAERETIREMPKLIEAKLEAPIAAERLHLSEFAAGA